ncbi:GlmM [Desulforapulum autotrophicum HRM2]|uniref:Phosphoglucosamine mutase n=1 Tax=Desulforapulum autotrophicum (strain ATCC 43914 / DSM 3382 / VKM B-1955 / HRM2) TaxID=177437 RepID=GLMM_DESAH|nr:phosphoglucosamine mutase [Desulforapulum autotrophicum]C0QGV9.1 RecName: Full=Phosphoglucosamine mutase [Desulforapulum autotrophicum HRM2]ACN15608.1 GlmM [Desulforapulum autotrophicum HRM2]
MGKLFGTDGIRGFANIYPMTVEVALKTGRAVARFAKEHGGTVVIIGRDTRRSGDMLEAALAAGISSMGINVLEAGVIPTPGVAFLTATVKGAGAGVVISASHNPFHDNGIKVFKSGGLKLTDPEEAKIESYIFDAGPDRADSSICEPKTSDSAIEPGTISTISNASAQYANFLTSCYQRDLDKNTPDQPLKIVVDCSNGASFKVAPMVFPTLGFETQFIFDTPDGKNINHNCGSQHTETLAKRVISTGADLGLAFDGDADRLIAIDEQGVKLTGDKILAICANHAKAQGRLTNNLVITTVMSNIGLSKALERLGIDHIKTGVGDREVLKEMWATGAVMGGEDSGHMIFSEFHSTGDGILSALCLIRVMVDTNKSLSDLATIMTVYPQVLMNVEVDPSRPDFMKIETIAREIKRVEQALNSSGRVLVRYSGTQPLLRVMVEGPDLEATKSHCQSICDAIKQASI